MDFNEQPFFRIFHIVLGCLFEGQKKINVRVLGHRGRGGGGGGETDRQTCFHDLRDFPA